MNKFFIPGVAPDRLHDTWEQICTRFGSWSGYRVTKRHVKCIAYDEHGVKLAANVGEPFGDEQVMVICELLDAYVLVRKSDLTDGDPPKIERSRVLGVEYFD